jgi:hypothetical protein
VLTVAVAYGVPSEIESEVLSRLDGPLRSVVSQFRERFCPGA